MLKSQGEEYRGLAIKTAGREMFAESPTRLNCLEKEARATLSDASRVVLYGETRGDEIP